MAPELQEPLRFIAERMTMCDPLPRRSRRPLIGALAMAAGICGALSASSVSAQSPEIPPAHTESLPAPARARAPAPATVTRPATPALPADAEPALRLPLTARLVTWPVWMVLSGIDGDQMIPPILELTFGLKRRWFELTMGVGIATAKVFNVGGTFFGMTLSVGFYSLQRDRVRLRHGFGFGVASEVIFERHPPKVALTPLPLARVQLLDILVRVGKGLWLEISPLTASFPGMYELSLGLRFELDEPSPTASRKKPVLQQAPEVRHRIHPFLAVEMGMVWWQHYQPPVLGSSFGRVGFRYRWFETAVGIGSPAWATWRAKGLYEVFVDVGFYSLRRARLRLRHQVRLGMLFHNPPFEPHTWSGVVMHADFCIVVLALGRGFWVELQPLTISIAPRDQLSTSVALRYEF
jgi:hypothetical protein